MTPEAAAYLLVQLEPAVEASRRLLIEAQRPRSWLKESSGGQQETVTELDLAVEERIIAAIRANDPNASIYSEETRQDPSVLSDQVCVVLDPIDGTDLLVAGQSGFSISLAILSERRLIAGLLDFPARDQRFRCSLGHGAELNGERLQLDGARSLLSARVSVSSTQLAMPSLQQVWRSLGVAEVVPTPGFTAKLASILLGQSDAALYLPVKPRPTYVWDYAAAALLLEEAGGTLTTLRGERFLDVLPVDHRAGWLAANHHLLEAMEAAVAAALDQVPGDD